MSTVYHSKYYAHELTRRFASDRLEKLFQSLFNAAVDLNPHQVEAVLFAFRSPLSRGAILADEVGLGKTIEAGLIMQGLTTLRPKMAQTLLAQCRSVKVKRLFMVLGEHCNHVWLRKLDVSRVDFGKGKRMMVKGGSFDSKYNITVPAIEA